MPTELGAPLEIRISASGLTEPADWIRKTVELWLKTTIDLGYRADFAAGVITHPGGHPFFSGRDELGSLYEGRLERKPYHDLQSGISVCRESRPGPDVRVEVKPDAGPEREKIPHLQLKTGSSLSANGLQPIPNRLPRLFCQNWKRRRSRIPGARCLCTQPKPLASPSQSSGIAFLKYCVPVPAHFELVQMQVQRRRSGLRSTDSVHLFRSLASAT